MEDQWALITSYLIAGSVCFLAAVRNAFARVVAVVFLQSQIHQSSFSASVAFAQAFKHAKLPNSMVAKEQCSNKAS